MPATMVTTPSSSVAAPRAAATKMYVHCFEGGARTCRLWLRDSVNCDEVGGSSSTHGQVVVLKPIMKSIGGLQRSVDVLKKEKAEKEEKEKCLKKNLDDLGDHLASVVQNVHDL
ncbi:unnamed protein product [Miscanthus lutarioriparius]|uniref:Uncharacterized protein n=1 Tax=Miscanthus lutarioriparius TaxID=422564 RepID=A0A811QZW9_9POAL|nr:unnamed protein product [Miscanthus lutarioriparius]